MKKYTDYLLFAGLLFLILMPLQIFAGDFSRLNFIGFSKDGKFTAFEEYGTSDGAGFPYSKIYVIDTEKNSYAAAPVSVMIENESATEAQARNKAKLAAAKTLLKYKIVAGNTGTHVISRLPNDLSFDSENANSDEKARFAEIVDSNYRKGDYELSLKSVLTKTKDCEVYQFDNYKFELTLKNKENNATTTLQKDVELPKARGCAMDYAIREVFVYEKFITVFLAVQTPGFEGPDSRFMTVTGKLN